jgi:hypothetical protein
MSISKEVLEKACNKALEEYIPDNNGQKTFDDLEKIAAKFSDSVMRRALEIALEEAKTGQKKTYVKSVVRMLNQLDSESGPF